MPKFEAFKDADSFYNTAFHELTHWTGAESRCNRKSKTSSARRTMPSKS